MKYSIIVPVYKVEKYIARCIESILKQTIQDFELILIDDGSPDKSGEICDKYEMKDQRIRVIHQENRGVSAARNRGLELAQGKYVVFVDSDDSVSDKYLEHMEESESDLVITGVENIEITGKRSIYLQFSSRYEKKISYRVIQDLIEQKAINYTVSKRYKTDIIRKNKIRFSESIDLGEDTLFCVDYICQCNDLELKEEKGYFYYKYEEDTLSSFSKEYLKKLEKANSLIAKRLEENFQGISDSIEWKQRCWSVYYYSIFFILREWNVTNQEKIETLQEIFHNKDYRKLERNIDVFMKEDSKTIRSILKIKNGWLVFWIWKILEMRRGKNEKKR